MSASEFSDRWSHELTQVGGFTPLALSIFFPLVGIPGAIMSYRWMLWMYSAWLFVSIVVRLIMVFESGLLEGLVDQTSLVADMVLYTVFVGIEFSLMHGCSFLAVLLSQLEWQRHLMSPVEELSTTHRRRRIVTFVLRCGMSSSVAPCDEPIIIDAPPPPQRPQPSPAPRVTPPHRLPPLPPLTPPHRESPFPRTRVRSRHSPTHRPPPHLPSLPRRPSLPSSSDSSRLNPGHLSLSYQWNTRPPHSRLSPFAMRLHPCSAHSRPSDQSLQPTPGPQPTSSPHRRAPNPPPRL